MRDGAMKCLRYSLHFFHQLEVLLPGAQGHLGEEKHNFGSNSHDITTDHCHCATYIIIIIKEKTFKDTKIRRETTVLQNHCILLYFFFWSF